MFCTKCGAQNPDDAGFCHSCGTAISTGLASAQAPTLVAVPAPAVHYAGFWRRFVALIIDGLILAVPNFVILMFFGLSALLRCAGADEFGDWEPDLFFNWIGCWFWASVILLLLDWMYHAAFESSRAQATPGKMALGIIVTDMDGQRVSFATATGRHFGKIISGLILDIGFMMAGWTQKKQALHDMMANCLVVCKRT